MMPTEDWKYQVSLALPEGTSDATLSALYDIVEAALKERDERAAKAIAPLMENHKHHCTNSVNAGALWVALDAAIRNEDTNA